MQRLQLVHKKNRLLFPIEENIVVRSASSMVASPTVVKAAEVKGF